jgi:hypothetical protein
MYQMGSEYTILKEDILELNASTEMFKLSTPEEDLIHKKLQPGGSTHYGEWMSLTEIQQYLMVDTKFNYLNTNRIGQILTSHGFEKQRRSLNLSKVMMYFVSRNPT